MKTFVLGLVVVAGIMSSCSPKAKEETTLSGLNPKKFQAEIDGKQAGLYTLKNSAGMEVCITNFGGRIVSVLVPDKHGNRKDVVLGFDSLADYRNIPSDFGASIGRYANRIAQGRIEIDGETIQLPQNNYGHCLHGGPEGWQYQMYEANQIDGTTLELTRFSPDGDQNFPGNVRAKVRFHLTDDNAIDIQYEAVTDKKTVINMTNHSYFNLSGNPAVAATDHLLYVNADGYTPVDSTFMTTGEIVPVAGTPNGKMQSGIDVLLELNNFEEKLDSTDIVITGEGKMDYQSACGKVIHGIARKCKKYNVPVLVISGSLGEEINQLYSMGVSGMEASVCNIISLNNAMDNAEKYLCYAAERVLRVLKTGMELVQNEKI